LRRHLTARKVLCPPTFSEESPERLLEKLADFKPFHCLACSKCFTTRQGRSQHKACCKGNTTKEQQIQQPQQPQQQSLLLEDAPADCDMVKIIYELRDEVKLLRQQATERCTTTNNIQVNQINNHNHNQVIHAFGKEDMRHLTHGFLNTCVRKTNKGLIELLETLHFGSEKKNANVRILNKKLQLAETNDGSGNWKYERRDQVLNALLDKGHGILQDHFDDNQDEIKESVSESMFEYIVQWFQRMEDKDKSIIEDVLLDIYVLLLNKSKTLTAP
jgi:hypothetical protein